MIYRKMIFTCIIVMALLPSAVLAAPPTNDVTAEVYVVQADDWLGKLAEKFYGTPLAYPAIIEATNTKASQDDMFVPIDDPYQLVVGQALLAPTFDEFPETLLAEAPLEKTVMPEDVIVAHNTLTEEQQTLLAGLDVVGQPPELFNETWLNSEPLKLADLHGKVVIVEFWTFG